VERGVNSVLVLLEYSPNPFTFLRIYRGVPHSCFETRRVAVIDPIGRSTLVLEAFRKLAQLIIAHLHMHRPLVLIVRLPSRSKRFQIHTMIVDVLVALFVFPPLFESVPLA
jgi:hypothetical protein